MEQGTRMPLPKRKRGGPRTEKRRLYLIFDDWPWGYSFRALKLSPRSPHRRRASRHPTPVQHPPLPERLPSPSFRVGAPRGNPWEFAAVGTRIVVTHGRNQVSVPDGFMPILDVRSQGITFGPGHVFLHLPIYISVGDDELFALCSSSFETLSLEKLWPPRLESLCTPGFSDDSEWSWCELSQSQPPFSRLDVISYALHSDGRNILFSTDEATFAFDTTARVWEEEQFGGQSKKLLLPFTGHAHFVPALDAFVGLSKDSPGHLCSCNLVVSDGRPVVSKIGEENLFDEDPEVFHVGATLVYLGGETGSTEFCLVQCVRTGDPNDDDSWREEDALMEVVVSLKHNGCRYRLTTFSLAYDDNGVLTTGETCLVKIYEVPEETTDAFVASGNSVAFWL